MYTARQHPDLTVTGLSHESGGWIGRRPFLYRDPVYPGAFPDVRRIVRARLEDRFHAGQLRLAQLPGPLPALAHREPGPLSADRIQGVLWGAAIGDALGNTTESMHPAQRRVRVGGDVRDYQPNRYAGGRAVGLPSDDTQLLVWTLESLLANGQPDELALVTAWRQAPLFGIGSTMRACFRSLDHLGLDDPWASRQHSAGNGALMRMAGAALPHLWTLDAGLYDTVALTSALSHDDASSTAACVALAEILRRALTCGPAGFGRGDFVATYVAVAAPLEGQVQLQSRVPGSGFVGPIWQLVQREVPKAVQAGLSPLVAGQAWYSGAFLLETVPTVLHLLELYRDDPEEALVRAASDTWDNDTVAAIVGAVVGALHGYQALPKRWRDGLLGRTSHDDDGRLDQTWHALRRLGGMGLAD